MCSAVEVQLAGKLIIFIHFRWETVNISSVSIRAGWLRKQTEGDWRRTRSHDA